MNKVVINRPSRALSFGTYRYVYSIFELDLRTKYSHSKAGDEYSYIQSEIKKIQPKMVRIKVVRCSGWVYIGVEMPREDSNNGGNPCA